MTIPRATLLWNARGQITYQTLKEHDLPQKRSEFMEGSAFLASIPSETLAHRMGIEFTSFTSEQVVATMPVSGNTQPFGIMHGGAYVVLGETLGSLHATFVASEDVVAVGIDVNATHTGAAVQGVVTAVCTPIHIGRTLAVHQTTITNEDGRLCSTVRITNFYKTIPQPT